MPVKFNLPFHRWAILRLVLRCTTHKPLWMCVWMCVLLLVPHALVPVNMHVRVCVRRCLCTCVCEQRVKEQCKPPWCETGFSLWAPSRSSRCSASHYLSTSTHPVPQTEREEKKNIKGSQRDCRSNLNRWDVSSLLTWRRTLNTVHFLGGRTVVNIHPWASWVWWLHISQGHVEW